MRAQQLRLDFYSFYASAVAYIAGFNPYKSMMVSFLPKTVLLPENLNPPFFLQLISPLAQLNIKTASSIWFFISLTLGIWGAFLTLQVLPTSSYLRKNWFIYLLLYLGMYSTIMNTSYSQVGGILLFFITAGYYFFLRKYDYWAGILWGIIIAIKLFPALLFVFALNQKRYRLFFVMLLTFILACLWPMLTQGSEIYEYYFQMVFHIMWQGGSWNASISGFLFRLFPLDYAYQHLLMIKIIYFFISLVLLAWYAKKINFFRNRLENHRAFCFTLALMILMSPMGWLYYFSLLLMPLIYLWHTVTGLHKISLLWIIGLFLINFPLAYIPSNPEPFIYKISIHSLYFYGLLLIVFMLVHYPEPSEGKGIITPEASIYPVMVSTSLALGLFTILYSLISH